MIDRLLQAVSQRNNGLFALILPFLLSCSQEPADFRQESFVFGTRVEIIIPGTEKTRAELSSAKILQRFDELHRKLHAWQPSELDSLNAAFSSGTARMAVDPEMEAILADAKDYSQQSKGLFNPAIGNLVKLWGFHGDANPGSIPDSKAISRWLAVSPSMQDVHLGEGQAWSSNPAVRIDLGGYAKGYALDEAARILAAQGIRNALINIGGNVIALGRHGDRAWKVGIQHPRKAGVIAILELRDGEAIGTSGDYQRYFETAGRRYCHLIDPRNGQPANGMQAVTVLVSGKRAGVKSEVLTKPLFIGGSRELDFWLTRFQLEHVMAIDREGKAWVSPAMVRRLAWQNQDQPYQVMEAVR